MAERVLITTADLEPAVRLRHAFEEDGFDVELLTPGEHVTDVTDPVLLVLTGALQEKPARRLASEARDADHLPIIALLEPGEKANTELQWRLGVADAFTKPVDPSEVTLVGRRLIERRRLRTLTGIVGETDSMREALERVVQIAPVNSTVLITGESGTGKERIARGLHLLSPRRHRPFIAANVAALPETLLESELFGHEKGSFTGAVGQRKGFFELANHGSLFLDEIGEMPPTTQSKLLRVLEEREFMRVGGETPIRVDVRVIAATNQNLRYLVEAGRFRRDLYYRLNVLHIDLPPLRERRPDIPLLVDSFVREASRQHDRPAVAISPEAMTILMEYNWPGNVRELKNLIESMVVLSPGRIIEPQDIPPEIRDASHGSRLLPVHVPMPEPSAGAAPELEFIFRTLLQLRIDVDDLRRQFDDYKRMHPEIAAHAAATFMTPFAPPALAARGTAIEDAIVRENANDTDDEHTVVVFRPGTTMEQLEKQAITAALKEVAGNRRRAAEMLGMGERTLYRKIKEYGIPL
ncbi:MAG TPA: sigma-54 dependent transcriptional regulator [Longimicrobiales bacterium]|nr:sigma-54 dependent transcriptional regulator [Longimicrobiales bacterium]